MASDTTGVSTQSERRPLIERDFRRASIDVEWPRARSASVTRCGLAQYHREGKSRVAFGQPELRVFSPSDRRLRKSKPGERIPILPAPTSRFSPRPVHEI